MWVSQAMGVQAEENEAYVRLLEVQGAGFHQKQYIVFGPTDRLFDRLSRTRIAS